MTCDSRAIERGNPCFRTALPRPLSCLRVPMNHSGGGWGRGVVVVPGGGQSQVLDHAALRFRLQLAFILLHVMNAMLSSFFIFSFISSGTRQSLPLMN